MAYYAISMTSGIAHHGIPGQKWGVRNAEWYPIDAYKSAKDRGTVGDRTIRKIKDGTANTKNASGSKTEIKPATNTSRPTAETKRRGTVAAAWVVSHSSMALQAALAMTIHTVDPIWFVSNVATNLATDYKLIDNVKEMHNTKKIEKNREQEETDSKTGLKLKSSEMSMKDDVNAVNPDKYALGSDNNCVLCSVSYDLRRRGFDVSAGKVTSGFSATEYQNMYKNISSLDAKGNKVDATQALKDHVTNINKPMSRAYIKDLNNSIASQGNGARGILSIKWTGAFAGHAIAYEVENDKVKVIDAQQRKIWDLEKCPYFQTSTETAMVMRTDNATPNYEFLKKNNYIKY